MRAEAKRNKRGGHRFPQEPLLEPGPGSTRVFCLKLVMNSSLVHFSKSKEWELGTVLAE